VTRRSDGAATWLLRNQALDVAGQDLAVRRVQKRATWSRRSRDQVARVRRQQPGFNQVAVFEAEPDGRNLVGNQVAA